MMNANAKRPKLMVRSCVIWETIKYLRIMVLVEFLNLFSSTTAKKQNKRT